ncbi:hypothetical protein BH10ACI2_BH10ACI2_18930 [soil metagenome]
MRPSTKLYSCIISPDVSRDKAALVELARQFAHTIEVIADGILFDVSGLERLIGKPDLVARKILEQMQRLKVAGSIAVAGTVDTAMLLARQNGGLSNSIQTPDKFEQLPLADLGLERDTLNVFNELGIHNVKDLRAVPHDDLVGRYGKSFQDVIDVLEQKGRSFVTPNIKESSASWKFDLDQPVEDFEQLIFVVNHGLERLFEEVRHQGFSTEQLDISFRLSNKGTRDYEIKTSFPTLERSFWLKLVNLRISLDPPEATIVGVSGIAHFTKPRPAQRGLYAASRPEPESLLLTVNKLKKLVGEENVGVPVLLNQRLSESFDLDAEKLPDGKETLEIKSEQSVIGFTYYHPPLRAEVLVRDGRLVFIKTRDFSGHATEYSGVWKANSKWWDKSWKTQEWDVEVEGHGIYRLCKLDKEWFLAGEYD